ncbi:hypothetical protein [Nocardia goodfellowii]|uniref:Uncharacterized protein n=1 Tax=Nocardia goodfellowii TaxID=882446 RepID=A0ABS4QFQ4_9NOCA|nr:hypothetical protein [Nocardia goodfellowii]MBP2190512.1 hypothetical protein [Nocardia goodfellowii]
MTTTSYGSGLLSAPERTIDTVIADHLARAEHANRNIPDSELGAAQRLALQAYDADAPRVEERTGRVPLDAETVDYANFVLLALRRSGNRADSGRKALARNDSLLQPPTPGRRYTQPCPHCDQLTFYTGRYPRAVCDDCANRTTDHTGRRVTGFNTHLSGGMIAYYTDTLAPDSSRRNEECAEVTRTGTCYLDGRPATMSEARFGGIVVQLV